MMDGLFPIATTLISILASGLLGMILNKQGEVCRRIASVDDRLGSLDAKMFSHITASEIHEAGFVRAEERHKTMTQTVNKAHERIDSLKEARG